MSLPSAPDQLLARVARITLCSDQNCRFCSDEHLVVEMHTVEVRRGNAIAISYTWGAFKRKFIQLGHNLDGEPVMLELGEEWFVRDLIVTLASLGMEQGPCWIDQLSIPQKDDEIRLALATVPSIYRCFDVVALMPGRPCQCLRQAIHLSDQMKLSDTGGVINIGANHLAFYRHVMRRMSYCLSAASSSSWFDRIWTRQELMYSRRINVVWTAMEDAKCVYIPEDGWTNVKINFEDLTPYSAALLANLRSSDCTDLEAVIKLHSHHTMFMQSGAFALRDYVGKPSNSIAEELLCRFLNGEVISSKLPDVMLQNDAENLERFVRQLGIDANSIRSATQARDYVAAIWVDCPRYHLPVAYKSMELGSLIQNAIDQLRDNFGVSLPSNAPNGLFENKSGSGLWNPTYYVRQATISDLKHIYGPLASENLQTVPLVGISGLPLSFLKSKSRALSFNALNYEDVTGIGLSVEILHEALKRIAQSWPFEIVGAWSNDFADRISQLVRRTPSIDDSILFEMQILSRNTLSEGGRLLATTNLSERQIRNIEAIDHHAIVYRMVTAVLRLDENLCRQHGLKLILGPSLIGLSRRDIHDGASSLNSNNVVDEKAFITISVGDHTNIEERKLFEARKIDADGPNPRYRAFAIWVPSTSIKDSDIGAIVQKGATDAILD